jgi:hypothetical protein
MKSAGNSIEVVRVPHFLEGRGLEHLSGRRAPAAAHNTRAENDDTSQKNRGGESGTAGRQARDAERARAPRVSDSAAPRMHETTAGKRADSDPLKTDSARAPSSGGSAAGVRGKSESDGGVHVQAAASSGMDASAHAAIVSESQASVTHRDSKAEARSGATSRSHGSDASHRASEATVKRQWKQEKKVISAQETKIEAGGRSGGARVLESLGEEETDAREDISKEREIEYIENMYMEELDVLREREKLLSESVMEGVVAKQLLQEERASKTRLKHDLEAVESMMVHIEDVSMLVWFDLCAYYVFLHVSMLVSLCVLSASYATVQRMREDVQAVQHMMFCIAHVRMLVLYVCICACYYVLRGCTLAQGGLGRFIMIT